MQLVSLGEKSGCEAFSIQHNNTKVAGQERCCDESVLGFITLFLTGQNRASTKRDNVFNWTRYITFLNHM